MNWNIWIRQFHRWVSILFTLVVMSIFIMLGLGKKPAEWTAAESKNVRDFWLGNLYAGARDQLAPLEAEKAPYVAERDRIEKATPITKLTG